MNPVEDEGLRYLDTTTYSNARREWNVREHQGDVVLNINKDKNRLVYEETEHYITIKVVEK